MGEKKILFLCTGNSCRSQIAEGYTRALQGDEFEVYSAGISPHGLNPFAVKVMAEAGIDIAKQTSKHVDGLRRISFDYVVTVCGKAEQKCPTFPGNARHLHIPFDDPPELAKGAKTEAEALVHYRRVRDEICTFVEHMPRTLEQPKN